MSSGRRSDRWQAGLIVAAAVLGVGIYLAWSIAFGVWGFALDDAWIHQTYARNLVESGQFAFVPGQPSSGSTSPLWTLLIALGYLLRIDYKSWTYALGALSLIATALGVWQLSRRLFPERPSAALVAGLACALEWHLIWAAVSGMETVLFTALAAWLFVATISGAASPIKQPFLASLLSGLLVLTRPEGLLLIALMMLAHILQEGWWQRAAWTTLGSMLLGILLLLAPWLAFNWQTSGTPFPNTFYAKQIEYASVLATVPFVQRISQVFLAPFIGAQVLLIPGLVAAAWSVLHRALKHRTWMQLVPVAWVMVHLGLYAVRLPVAYQHGRYEMPVIPSLIALSVGGTAMLLRWNAAHSWPRVLSRAMTLACALTLLAFVLIGARAYSADVAIIEGEMVRVARWLAAATQPTDLIAAHDIGAIGYFTRRPLLDLAGLVSPEVIPFIRDERRLNDFVRQRGAAFLVTFPAWYPELVRQAGLLPVFAGNAPASPEHITVYRLPGP